MLELSCSVIIGKIYIYICLNIIHLLVWFVVLLLLGDFRVLLFVVCLFSLPGMLYALLL